MRDFASCFSEHAINVKVSDASCSGSGSSGKSSVVAADQSVQTAVTSLYRTRLSAGHKDVLIKITWSRTHMGPMLSLGVDDEPKLHQWKPNAIATHLLRKRKGARSYASGASLVGLYWDYSAPNTAGSSPEPVSGFYVVVVVDAEIALSLGDLSGEFVKKLDERIPTAESSLVSRREQVLGQSVYSTRARFGDGGREHDILIRCKGDGGGGWDTSESELVVSVDKKRVVQVRRLQWNFRGNQTIFIDGAPVDMMWDVGSWWFSSPPGHAVFMFRRRSALQSRLWLEEEMLHKERGISGFSLLIQAFKNP